MASPQRLAQTTRVDNRPAAAAGMNCQSREEPRRSGWHELPEPKSGPSRSGRHELPESRSAPRRNGWPELPESRSGPRRLAQTARVEKCAPPQRLARTARIEKWAPPQRLARTARARRSGWHELPKSTSKHCFFNYKLIRLKIKTDSINSRLTLIMPFFLFLSKIFKNEKY